MDFRKQIKYICKQQGITQVGLAEKLGITDISLNRTLRGEYPQLQTLERIAVALGVSVVELFEQPVKEDKKTDVISCPYCGGKIKVVKE
ncbi:MAG: helix-turn-helix transcriptional regulator [Candidatus Azobacteroides sp.]|nr:helix-turn-helix transcriptional regulator [Candidatus Azobacteroides sp.]